MATWAMYRWAIEGVVVYLKSCKGGWWWKKVVTEGIYRVDLRVLIGRGV